MEDKRSSQQYNSFLCKPLGVFEDFAQNGGIFDRNGDLGGKESTEKVQFGSDQLDGAQNDFWGFPSEDGRELCDAGVKDDIWADSLNGCGRKLEFFDFESGENEQKRNILIRHDFNKEMKSSITFNGDVQKSDQKNDLSPKPEILTDIPLSPETQKKNELCSYLQLMNMNNADKKTVNAIQNRRSNRVKNLKIMSEKRNMEQKLLVEFKESLEKKSFEELGLVIEENYQITNAVEKINFNIDLVPQNLLKEVKNFDDTILKVIGKDIKKKIQNEYKNNNNIDILKDNKGHSKKASAYTENSLQDQKNKKEKKDLNIISITKNKIGKPKLILRKNSNAKLLRSSINLNDVGIRTLTLDQRKIKSLRSVVNLNNIGIKSLTLNEREIRQMVNRKKVVSNDRIKKIMHKGHSRQINVKIKMNNERINSKKSRILRRIVNVRKNTDRSKVITRKQKNDIAKRRSSAVNEKTTKNQDCKTDIKTQLDSEEHNFINPTDVEIGNVRETRNSKHLKVCKENDTKDNKQEPKVTENEAKNIKFNNKNVLHEVEVRTKIENNSDPTLKMNQNHIDLEINTFNISKAKSNSGVEYTSHNKNALENEKIACDLKKDDKVTMNKMNDLVNNDVNVNHAKIANIYDSGESFLIKTPNSKSEKFRQNWKNPDLGKPSESHNTDMTLKSPADLQQCNQSQDKSYSPTTKSLLLSMKIAGKASRKNCVNSTNNDNGKDCFEANGVEKFKTVQSEITTTPQRNTTINTRNMRSDVSPKSVSRLNPRKIQLSEDNCCLERANLSKLTDLSIQNEIRSNSEKWDIKNELSEISSGSINIDAAEKKLPNKDKTPELNVDTRDKKIKSPKMNCVDSSECHKNILGTSKINTQNNISGNDQPGAIVNNNSRRKVAPDELEPANFQKSTCLGNLGMIPLKKRKISLLSSVKKKNKPENVGILESKAKESDEKLFIAISDNIQNTDLISKNSFNENENKIVVNELRSNIIENKPTKNNDFSPKSAISVSDTTHMSSPDMNPTYDNSLPLGSKNSTEISKLVFRKDKTDNLTKSQTSFNVVDLSQNAFVNSSSKSTYNNYIAWREHNYMKNPDLDMNDKELYLNESTSCSEFSTDEREFHKESYKEIPKINSVPPTDIFEPKHESKPETIPVERTPKTPTKPKKALHKLLMQKSRSSLDTLETLSSENCFDDQSSTNSIRIDFAKGKIRNAYYLGFNLVVVQEQLISFWTQSPLGNMLGVHNLWVLKGQVQRLPLDSNYICKESQEVVVNLENKSCAYIELWMKEHKSEKRALPLADVFATVYFWTSKNPVELNKKLLQLANIKGNITDVQYVVLRVARKIIVSWVETQNTSLTTIVSCYVLSPDYQTVMSTLQMTSVNHYVQSLHTIGDCSDVVVGFGENHITIWELEYGEVFETIEINQRYSDPRMLWLERDRGLLFFMQYHKLERLLMLIAVNGYSKESKKMQVFRIPAGYNMLKGVCVDNNMLSAVFKNGIICWNMKTGDEIIAELSSHPYLIPSNKHIIEISSNTMEVTHFQTYFLTNFDLQS